MTLVSQRARADGEAVRRTLLAAGFRRVGFARAGRAPHAERFEEWLAAGHAADMEWIARNAARRLDPRVVVEGARSVIVVAAHYRRRDRVAGAEGEGASEGSERADISSYAAGEDYHRVIERRLRAACRELTERFEGERFRYYVDTGPVLERAWAERAGVGWIGKNTCSIHPEDGSYFFIGVVLTTLELPADAPSTNHCGSCRLCLDACPTGAFAAPYRLDARLCISYQTIENRGAVPEALRSAHGNLVFGCDICQDVCPFNRPERASSDEPADAELAPRAENVAPTLESLALLEDDAAFRARFPASAVRRAKFTGLLRNVAIAIGNSGRPRLEATLDEVARRPHGREPTVAEAIVWARARLSAGGSA